MSSGMTIRGDGTVEMAYLEGTGLPWHEGGQMVLKKEANKIEIWKSKSHMDWSIIPMEIFYEFQGEKITCTDRVMLTRSDSGRPLNIVSTRYNFVQPAQIIEFFDDLVKSVGMTIETAGTLFDGKKLWALAKIGEKSLLGRDKVNAWVLLTTACDGSMPTIAKIVYVRVVCDNTLTAALGGNGEEIRIRHSTVFDADAVKEQLGIAPKSFNTFMADIKAMSKVKLTDRKAKGLTTRLLEDTNHQMIPRVLGLWENGAVGSDLPGFEGTAWGWLNCVTEAFDHHANSKRSPSHEFDYKMFGKGNDIKASAFEMAKALT